jgi:two-component system sensor histidine kinase CpxA
MTVRWPLSRKVLLLALLNLALLAGLLAVFVASQLRPGESILLAPARERVLSLAAAFSLQFQAASANARPALFEDYRKQYGADFFLISGRGLTLAGPDLTVPQDILDRARALLPPPPQRRGPPPVREDPPPRRQDGPPPRREDEDGPPGEPPPPPPPRRRPPPLADAGLPDEGPVQRAPLPRESVFLLVTKNPVRYWAGARIETGGVEGRGTLGVLLIRANSLAQSNLFFNWSLWLGVGLSIVGVTAACWLPFIRGMTRAIGRMDRATRQIAEGRFDVAVAARRHDELGDLGQQIDRMAGRLQGFVTNQKRFLGDIAHELSAPIARIQFALGILEQKAEEPQREHVAALHEEIQEMSALVNELLSFSRAGMSGGSAKLVPVAVGEVARRAAVREGFAGTPIEVNVEPGLAAMANEVLLLRALSNILRNAVRYAGSAGPVTVTARHAEGQVEIAVADRGPGLPAAELENVFAPFYRPEASRTRETGGAGLGLAIVRTCIEACGGTVVCRNRQPRGLEVIVTLRAVA